MLSMEARGAPARAQSLKNRPAQAVKPAPGSRLTHGGLAADRKRPSYFKSFNSTTVPKSLPEASVARASMALNPSFSSGHFASSALASA